jgi:phosphoserine phosphatase
MIHPHWDQEVAEGLAAILADPEIRGRRAVFDFDGTVIAGDVTETVAARAWESGDLPSHGLWSALGLTGEPGGRPPFSVYQALSDSDTVDGYPHAHHASSALLAQAFAGLTVEDVATLTRTTCRHPQASVGPLRPVDPVVDLIGDLHSAGVECWILSAGLVWCVRTALDEVVNPVLASTHGEDHMIPGERVVAVSTLLRDADSWWSDRQLIRSPHGPAYLGFHSALASQLHVTAAVVGPVTFGGGKVGAWHELAPDTAPLIMVGDGAGDVPLMRMSDHALWIAPITGAPTPPGLPESALIQRTPWVAE